MGKRINDQQMFDFGSSEVVKATAQRLARAGDPATSQKAARIAASRLATSKKIVLEVLASAGVPLTAEQVCERVPASVSPSRVRGALSDLVKCGSAARVDENGTTMRGLPCTRYASR